MTRITIPYPYSGDKANLALDNLASVAINTSLISDTDSTDDLGSSAKYWANGYVDKIYLNATASLDGTVAGQVSLTGILDVSGHSAFGSGATSNVNVVLVEETLTVASADIAGLKVLVDASTQYSAGMYALIFSAIEYQWKTDGSTANIVCGLYGSGASAHSGPVLEVDAGILYAKNLSDGTVTAANGLILQVQNSGTGTITTAKGLNILTPSNGGTITTSYGLYIANQDIGTTKYAIYTGAGDNRFGGLINTTEHYQVDGVQVVSNRVIDARADDVANSGDATTDGLIDALRDAMISHGLISAS